MRYDIDICDLISVTDVEDTYQCGPNGSVIYSMEYLEANIHWFIERINEIIKQREEEFQKQHTSNSDSNDNESSNNSQQVAPPYLLIDMPGQIELYTHDRYIILSTVAS